MADNKSSLVQIAQAVLDQTEQAIKVTGNITVPPPVGASTLAEQEAQTAELQAIKGHVDGVEAKLDTLVTQTDGVEGSLSSINTKASTLSVVGSGAAATALRVQLADESLNALENISVTVNNLNYVNRVRLVYSVTNVTTGAWIQLLASVGATAIKEIEIFDSSGETLELGVGAASSEVSKSYVFPGGNGKIPMQIAANDRLAIKAVSATANSGEIIINLYG